MKFTKLFLLLALLALAACVPIQPGVTPAVTPTAPDNPEGDLAATSWQLVSFGPTGAVTPVLPGAMITLEFGADGQAGGHGGCNSYGGPYTVQGDTLTFGEIVSTLMACADQAVTQQEQQYLQALSSADRFAVTDDTLTLWYDNGSSVLTFARASSAITPLPPTPTAHPSTPLPTVTPAPPSGGVPGEDVTRIRFGPGETSAEINATIAERATDFYVLRAQQGQIMSVEITSPRQDVLLSVVGEDGTPYKRYQNGPPSWTSTLPATQDYYLHAVSVGPATDYTLRVWVEPLGDSQAERVEFAPGETSTNRSGALPAGGIKAYVLRANAGQTMHVQTVGWSAPVNFTIRSPGGATWEGELQPAGAYIHTAQVTLPQDGDYEVTLAVPPDAGATRYDVAFTILNGAPPTTPAPTEPPERIEFAPGAISAQRSGLLPSGPGVLQYVLAANAGQTMTVDATSDDVPLSLTITEPNGMMRIAEVFPTDGGYHIGHQFVLPETGDYLVTLRKDDHTPSTNYTVDFTIQ
ncbi:MAG: META domain-containing protein [Caldilinea sp. CFX5]|nr:META domain-containing protein [Caldilinea sp. CFX5]